ncbi:MAG TPA: hypothetical protein VGK67_21990 [Myxococcales bacterium]|jgi:hypothetical protein
MSELHPILAAAVAATEPRVLEHRPRFSGAPPQLAPEEMAQLGIWCARWVEAAVPAASRQEFSEALEEAEGFAADPERARLFPYSQGHVRYRAEHLSIARLAAAAARRAVNNPAATRVALCAAVKLVVRLERGSAKRDPVSGAQRVTRFLEALDEEIFRLEASAALLEHAGECECAVEAVLWRKTQGAKVAYWLLRLVAKEPRYGLLGKTAGRWRWIEGPRDDALSTVPDELFPEAVETSLARDAYLARPRPVTR